MLELVTEKGNTRAQTWIDAEKHFHFSILSGSSHKQKLYKGRKISTDEEILYRKPQIAHSRWQPVWNRRQFPVITTKRAVLQRAWRHSQSRPWCNILVAFDVQKVGAFLFHSELPHHTASGVRPRWKTRVL